MTNEKENLEIKKKSQQVTDEELNKVAGGHVFTDCQNNQDVDTSSCSSCN